MKTVLLSLVGMCGFARELKASEPVATPKKKTYTTLDEHLGFTREKEIELVRKDIAELSKKVEAALKKYGLSPSCGQ